MSKIEEGIFPNFQPLVCTNINVINCRMINDNTDVLGNLSTGK